MRNKEEVRSGSSTVIAWMLALGLYLSFIVLVSSQLAWAQQAKDSSTPERKARIAVMPARYVSHQRSAWLKEFGEAFGLSDLTAVENLDLTDHLINALVNCRKFDVLERDNLLPLIREIDFTESDYGNAAKSIKKGKMLGADYLVLPEINFIHMIVEPKKIPYVPVEKTEYKAKISARLKVVQTETGRIVASEFDEIQYKQTPKSKDEFRQSFALSFLDNFYSAVATKLTSDLIDIAYPIKVVAVADSIITLNTGEGAIAPQEILDIYKPGDLVRDPDTGEILGYMEQLVGKAKVFRVEKKMSKARIIECTDEIRELYICRRALERDRGEKSPPPRID